MESKILLTFLLFLTIILSIGAISADENIADVGAENLDEISNVDSNIDVSADSSSGDDSNANTNDESSTGDASANSSASPAPAATASPKTESSASVKKVSTKVSADQVANEYKKSKYFKVKIKDYKGKLVKNIKINLKVYTGSKTKIYTVKTNYKGIAKFNTKSLKLGDHKVVISSADDKYKISKTSRIFIGKKRYVTLKQNVKKVLKNKDVLGLKVRNDEDEKDVDVVYKKKPKYTKVTKAIFYLKNKNTCKIIKETESSEFENGRWELPDEDFTCKYTLVKVKVWYLSSK